METERMMILQMVEDGDITPQEGARLLEAVGEEGAPAAEGGPFGVQIQS